MHTKPNGQAEINAYKRINNIPEFDNHAALFGASIKQAAPLAPGNIFAEFGVYKGKTLAMIITQMLQYHADCLLVGFDSFEGLPEDYTPYYTEGKFALSQKDVIALFSSMAKWNLMPHYVDGNYAPLEIPSHERFHSWQIELVRGLFQDTLEDYLDDEAGDFVFVHMDADLYSSTKYVLDTLMSHDRLRVGSVIQFDEFFLVGQDDGIWYCAEYDAFHEFAINYNVTYRWIGSHTQRVAVVLTDV